MFITQQRAPTTIHRRADYMLIASNSKKNMISITGAAGHAPCLHGYRHSTLQGALLWKRQWQEVQNARATASNETPAGHTLCRTLTNWSALGLNSPLAWMKRWMMTSSWMKKFYRYRVRTFDACMPIENRCHLHARIYVYIYCMRSYVPWHFVDDYKYWYDAPGISMSRNDAIVDEGKNINFTTLFVPILYVCTSSSACWH